MRETPIVEVLVCSPNSFVSTNQYHNSFGFDHICSSRAAEVSTKSLLMESVQEVISKQILQAYTFVEVVVGKEGNKLLTWETRRGQKGWIISAEHLHKLPRI